MRVILPSNASLDVFPNNSLASYTVQLPYPINLSTKSSWEVALAEVQFKKSWYNVKDASISFSMNQTETKVTLSDGYYKSNEELIQKLNDGIKCIGGEELVDTFKFEYDNITRICTLFIDIPDEASDFSLKISPALSAILNITDNLADLEVFESKCPSKPDKKSNVSRFILKGKDTMRLTTIYNILIYCDLAKPSVVGDVDAPLLRAVAVEDGHWKYQSTSPSQLQFIPVSKREIRTVSIYIFSDFGEIVAFTSGRTIVTLQLRRVREIHVI